MSEFNIVITHDSYLRSFEYWVREAEDEERTNLYSYNDCYREAEDRLNTSIRMLVKEIKTKHCE